MIRDFHEEYEQGRHSIYLLETELPRIPGDRDERRDDFHVRVTFGCRGCGKTWECDLPTLRATS